MPRLFPRQTKLWLFLRPDPAVWSIGARIIRRDSATAGRLRIVAEIRNLGGYYISGSGQQLVTLTEHLPGGDAVVAQQDFTRLVTGGNLSLSIEKEWSTTTDPPSDYILSIGYDPAITADGNPSNDDCHLLNNSRTLSGDDIHALFD